jgi:hypothetical protein
MTSDTKKAKADPAPKPEAAPKDKSTTAKDKSAPAADAAPAKSAETPAAATPAAESPAAAPSNYSRGEGQKPVTAAYKENWNAIFAKKTKTKTAKKKKR